MRAICEDCTLSNVCKDECLDSMYYDMGYNDAIEKATEWIKIAFAPVAHHYQCGINGLVEGFKKAMEL